MVDQNHDMFNVFVRFSGRWAGFYVDVKANGVYRRSHEHLTQDLSTLMSDV